MSVRPLLASLALAATLVLTPPEAAAETDAGPCGSAPDRPVVTNAVFNDPARDDPTAVVRQICSLVHQAPAGAVVRIAHFVISGDAGMDFARELIAAHERNVDVRIVIDGWQTDNPAVGALQEALGNDRSARSWIHVCTNLSPEVSTAAYIGSKGQHNKFYLFSRSGGAQDVVVQSSANFTDLNSTTYWNNVVTLVGNARLYRAYGSYFADLAAERRDDDYYRVVTTGSADGSATAYFFPRAGDDASTDTIVDALAPVGCRGGTVIRIGMSEWDTYRIAIADRLRELASAGCAVSIVHGAMTSEVRNRLTASQNIELRQLNSRNQLPGYVHSKYMIIEGGYDGDADATRVFTGSPNYNRTSLRRNDETLLRINSRTIYEQYLSNFARLRAVAQPVA